VLSVLLDQAGNINGLFDYFEAIWWLSELLVTGLQIWTYS
jgi:hypothetical protein